MDKNLALKSFTKVKTNDLKKVKGWGNIDPKLSEALDEIIDAGSKVADSMAVYGYVQSLPHSLKIVKCCLNTVRLADDIRKLGPIYSNLGSLGEVDKVLTLDRVLPLEDVEISNKYSADRREKEFLKENKIKFKYFYSNYDEYKRGIREQNRKYILNKWNIYLLELEQSDLRDAGRLEVLRDENKRIEESMSRKHLLREKIIHNEAVSINKHNKRRLHWKFGADLLSFAANIVEVFTFPVVAAFVYACRTPFMIYGICKKIHNNEDIFSEKVNVKDNHVLTTLQLPALLVDFWKVIDKWILKKIREKSEKSRNKEVLAEQLASVRREIGDDILDRVKGDQDKQRELIERLIVLEDKNMQERALKELYDIRSKIGRVLNKKREELKNAKKVELRDEGLENNIEQLKEEIQIMQLSMKELVKDIKKQEKRLEKLENEVIAKAGKGAKKDSRLLKKSRLKSLNEAICAIEKEKKDLNIGDREVVAIRSTFLRSKETIRVLNAKPKEFYLKFFNIKPMEDEGRIRSTARFVVNHIKELPNIDNLLDIQVDVDGLLVETREKMVKEVEKSHERILEMLKTFNMDEDRARGFIRSVIDYKLDKDNAPKSKDDLVKELVDSMKKEI